MTEIKKAQLTPELVKKGWVLREVTQGSDPILVRGARRADHHVDYLHGFVYAETIEEATQYDSKYGY